MSNHTTALEQEIAALKAELAQRKAQARSEITFKVSEKGAVSVYGLGRFPVTLYKEQWPRLLAVSAELLAFIAENDASLMDKATAMELKKQAKIVADESARKSRVEEFKAFVNGKNRIA